MDELEQAAPINHSDLHTCTTDDNTISAVSEKILRPRGSRLRPALHQADRSRSARRRQVRWFETERSVPPRTSQDGVSARYCCGLMPRMCLNAALSAKGLP